MFLASALRSSLRSTFLKIALAAGAVSAMAGGQIHAATVQPAPQLEKNTSTFLLSGEIAPGDLSRLQTAIAHVPSGHRIVLLLSSPGGSIDEGIALGRFIQSSSITTVAIQGSGCASACTFLFLAGRDKATAEPMRIMIKGARLGFHQGSIRVATDKQYSANDVRAATGAGQDIVRRVQTYFNDIKVDPEFLTLFLSAPNDSLTLLNELDALRLGIHVMDPATGRLIPPTRNQQAQR